VRDVMIRSILAGCLLLGPALSSSAGCNFYPSTSYSYTPYYTPYVQQNVEVKKYTVLEFVQPYFVGAAVPYVAPASAPAAPAAAAPSPCEAQITELRQQLLEMKRQLAPPPREREPEYQPRREEAPRPQREPRSQAPAQRSMFAAKCATCHDSAVSEKKGGKLSLFEFGQPLQMPPDIADKCTEEMRKDHMPPKGNKLTSAEFVAILCEIRDLTQK
jgi:mono/diheme cytochrome c family protein